MTHLAFWFACVLFRFFSKDALGMTVKSSLFLMFFNIYPPLLAPSVCCANVSRITHRVMELLMEEMWHCGQPRPGVQPLGPALASWMLPLVWERHSVVMTMIILKVSIFTLPKRLVKLTLNFARSSLKTVERTSTYMESLAYVWKD